MARKGTAQKRLVAIVNLYRKVHNKSAVTMDEVAEWSIELGLHPVPGIRHAQIVCDEWDERFAKITKELTAEHAETAEGRTS